jgi:Secretin and TonB N terminus short domain
MPPFEKTTLTALLILLTSNVNAGETAIAFDIPAQNLSAALKQLANQSHLQMLYDGPTVQGKHSVALKGRYTSQQALQKLLDGTGLRFVYTAKMPLPSNPRLLSSTSLNRRP